MNTMNFLRIRNVYGINRLTVLGISCLALAASSAHAALVAHWTLDDGSGTTAADSAFSNDGTLGGTPLPTWISGVDGGALEFSGAVDEEVTATVAGLPTGNSARTVSLWLWADASAFDQKFFSYGANTAAGTSFAWTLEDVGGNPTVFFRYGGGNVRFTGQSVTLSQWNHVAMVVPDGATQTNDVLLYLNGLPVSGSQGGGSAQILNTGWSEVVLGGDYPGGGSSNLDGRLDDVQLYEIALSSTEVQSLFNNPGSIIPEPSSVILVGLLAPLALMRRRRAGV